MSVHEPGWTRQPGREDSELPKQALALLLRLLGTSSLTALVFVAAPHSWMISIHSSLGMGALPEAPVVWYLARSTSAFYALLGGLFWVVSFDLRRYRPIVTYLGGSVMLLGVVLLIVDWAEGLPRLWTAWEGPFVAAFGLTVLVLAKKIRE
ncbi:MAG: hypothetical protein GY769_01495 [bacterium]|nr:hypothetical protein [bacterium]